MSSLPRLNLTVPIVEQNRTPTNFFHISWQLIVEAIEAIQTAISGGVGGTSLFIDGGDSTNSGTPYVAIDGGSA